MPRRGWKRIVVHHTASDWGTMQDVLDWHNKRWGSTRPGYHFLVLNGIPRKSDLRAGRRLGFLVGSVECGRPLDGDRWVEANEVGAHALGFNRDSIGIALVHKELEYPAKMIARLSGLVRSLLLTYPSIEEVVGHCELNPHKPLCPSIDMDRFREVELKCCLQKKK